MKFVKLDKYGFMLEPRYYFFGWSKTPHIFARQSAAQALTEARKLLPQGYNFLIWDAQRTLAVQILMIENFRRRFRVTYPDWSKKKVEDAVYTFCAKPLKKVSRLDTHRNGGSFDLTIADQKGRELWMGTDHDDMTDKAAMDYYETKKTLSPIELEARKNRRLLKKVLLKTEFINYHKEWWHWSWDK